MGVLDERLSERLQLKADLTLKQAVEISRLHETRKESRDVVRGDINSTVEFVKKPKNPRKSKKQQSKPKGGPQGARNVSGAVVKRTREVNVPQEIQFVTIARKKAILKIHA